MTEHFDTTTSSRVSNFLLDRFADGNVTVHSVDGGYSRNRRAIIDVDGKSVFAKEVDIAALPDDGATELGWLKKDYDVVTELAKQGLDVVPDWAELHLDGQLLLLPSYKKEDGWHWSLPEDESMRTSYVQAVVDATKQLEAVELPQELTEKLSLQPFFRDEIAQYEGIAPLFSNEELRNKLIEKYRVLEEKGSHLAVMNAEMVATLLDDTKLADLQERTARLADLPNDSLNHCDVRSDNLAYNENTGEVKLVDWNWTSYAPKKFGATEFLIDMARRGVDVSPWYDDMSVDLLAATVGYYMIRSLKPPLTPGSTLRDMQAETAAVANYLYQQIK
jgi:hypothetical protein